MKKKRLIMFRRDSIIIFRPFGYSVGLNHERQLKGTQEPKDSG